MATAAMPRSQNHYRMNGGLGAVLPPDETTNEMAVDCPPAYVAAHPPRSGTSTPRSAFEAPPPTPLNGTGTQNKTSKDLEAAAEVASTLPQPEMNFQRIHRMRESARRQKLQRQHDEKIRQQMAGEGAPKIDRLKHKTTEDELRANKKGVENLGYERDSYIDNWDHASQGEPSIGINGMFSSLNSISHKLDDPTLTNDLSFLKQLIQQETFQDALDLHNTMAEKTSTQSTSPPVTRNLQSLSAEICDELQYSELPQATDLIRILSKPDVKGLSSAHDGLAEFNSAQENDHENVNVHSLEDEEILNRISQYTDKKVRVVRIEKTSDALGATVRSEDDGTVTISRIISGGLAANSNLLHEGDEVIEVNGRSMRGLDVNEVGDVIGSMNGTLVFVLADPSKPVVSNGTLTDRRDLSVVKHVRALFDYEALDDPYLPCRELGLSFQKGDVLRIMCMDDSDWWQAYRDEDDDTHLSLAGLIPSQQFQHQRETLRISLNKESNAPENKKSLLCGRKKKKKEKKDQSTYKATEEDEVIQTYEEMALYHQPETRKRPIVLIGPLNVGRHELRQKLVDNDRERFASAISHTTRPPQDGEQEGRDYHFISVSEFESMVETERFVEYGSYQKTLYGTTVDSVSKVIDMGKICVLNLHAESLRTLYTSGLKPYILFIGPPPLERLRQNMSKEGKQIKEDELRKIIESARDIERRYAHYFDETIRNLDLNRSYAELLRLINKLDTEPQWVPASWLD
uniref:Protein PALS1 n=1 Tax=Phallusia mammillata TaxID=59560 RepID=A0A6F9DKG1_9ASCI|nr:MAGUK p55 subfamily member 5-like [Phallusia mammillata]